MNGFDAERVRFVLVAPRSPGNLGSCARALKNLGFSRLVLAAPQCDPLDEQARRLAVDAQELLEHAECHDSLDTALAGARSVVGTTRRRGKHRHPHWRLDEFAGELARLAAAGELAFVFGREDHGLSDAELDRCTHLVEIEAAEVYPSFNLAQAVLLVAYELRLAGLSRPAGDALAPPADHTVREAMYQHLEQALRAVGYLHDQSAEPIMRRWRRLFGRAGLTDDEVQLVRGVARQMLWAASRSR